MSQNHAEGCTQPSIESVVKEVLEAGGHKVWALRMARAVYEGRITDKEAQVKRELLKQANQIWNEAKLKAQEASTRLTLEEIEMA